MKKTLGILIAALFIVGAFAPSARAGDRLFKFERLIGVSGAFLQPPSNPTPLPLRGVLGGGAPWVIAEGEARLDDDGELRVEVEGLVLDPNDPLVISLGLAGINPVPLFFATLSCLDAATGAVVNIDTAPVPASTAGDAEISETLTLPPTCVAPIVLVRGVASAFSNPWFAASGF